MPSEQRSYKGSHPGPARAYTRSQSNGPGRKERHSGRSNHATVHDGRGIVVPDDCGSPGRGRGDSPLRIRRAGSPKITATATEPTAGDLAKALRVEWWCYHLRFDKRVKGIRVVPCELGRQRDGTWKREALADAGTGRKQGRD